MNNNRSPLISDIDAHPSEVDICPSNKATGAPLLKSSPERSPKYHIFPSF